jgi:hypothetical protein
VDESIWAVWFDLAEEEKDAHLRWLHGEYLPELDASRGIAWTAHYELHPEFFAKSRSRHTFTKDPVGQAVDHLVLVGATSSAMFFDDRSPVLEKNQSAETQRRLPQRKEVRWLIGREDFRLNGPEYAQADLGGAPSECIQMGSFNVNSPEAEIGLGQWYQALRCPQFSRSGSCIRMRKLLSVAGWARHSVLYEFTSNEERARNLEGDRDIANNQWGESLLKHTIHSPGSPVIGLRAYPE